MKGKTLDIRGQRFGRLVALEPTERRAKKGYVIWRCQCDCGNEAFVSTKDLGRGTYSCGCYSKEVHDAIRTKHGKRHTRLYSVHRTMLGRCRNPNAHGYKDYGGRGIKVCDEWLDFQTFYDWAMANGYDENAPRGKCTLDRIDVNGNYEPSNCRFATMRTQERNKRNNRLITYKGKTLCMKEWAEIAGIPYGTFIKRLDYGWSMERAMTTPVQAITLVTTL